MEFPTHSFTNMGTTTSQLSLPYSHPLFSSIITLYTLILLYFPHIFLKIIFSPLLISTLIILLTLLRLGASQQQLLLQQQHRINPVQGANNAPQQNIIQNDHLKGLKPGLVLEPELEHEPYNEGVVENTQCHKDHETCGPSQLVGFDSTTKHEQEIIIMKEKDSSLESWAGFECLGWAEKPEPALGTNVFLEWNVGAPLEVIYEAFEGEEDGGEAENDAFWKDQDEVFKVGIIERYPSLSRYYPESDSESDSDSDSSSSMSLEEEEEEEDRGDELIEICLDYGYVNKKIINDIIIKPKQDGQQVGDHNFDDEDNLIEIDISPTKIMSHFSW